MSETELNIGKLIKLHKIGNESIEEQMIRLLKENNVKNEVDYSIRELFFEEFENKYYIHNDEIFEVLNKRSTDYDIGIIEKVNENEYKYVLQFYNGGCGFGEALDDAFENTDI